MNLHPYAQTIMDALRKSYERSKQANPHIMKAKRSIAISMKKFPFYDVRDYASIEEVQQALQPLITMHFITPVYAKDHQNHIQKVVLNVEQIDCIYDKLYGIQSHEKMLEACVALLESNQRQTTTAWIQKFIQDELTYVKNKGALHRYAGKDDKELQERLAVLQYLQKKELSYIRNLSVALFQDTKYFETYVKKDILSILHKYEPTYLEAKAEDYEMSESELFRHLGFSMYPEVFLWKGQVSWELKDGRTLDTGISKSGFLIQDDMLDLCQNMYFPQDAIVILIENKAAYYHYVQHAQAHEVVIFAQGHFSPKRRQWYEQIARFHAGDVYLWFDIDYGGFTMYRRLKEQVFPNLKPMHMDKETFDANLRYAKHVSQCYLDKIKAYRSQAEFALFHKVMDRILTEEKILEQEAIFER